MLWKFPFEGHVLYSTRAVQTVPLVQCRGGELLI